MLRADILKRGSTLALLSQLGLLGLAAVMLVLLLSFQTSDQDVPALRWLSLFGGMQLLPVVVLVIALFYKARWAPWFGLAAAFAVLGLQTVTIGVGSGWLIIVHSILWVTTAIGLLADIVFVSKQSPPTGIGPLKAIMFGALGFSTALLPIGVMIACLFAAAGARGGVAPEKDFEARRAWGERIFGPYLDHIDGWVSESDVVRKDIGDVLTVAPIGGPNRYQGGFTDGAFAVMNLEVIGTRGKGVLYLPYVEIWNTGHLQSIGLDATWKFAGETEYVAKSGKSYLAEHGLETIYMELLELAAREEAGLFVERWDAFEIALANSELEPSFRRLNHAPKPIEELRDEYREPLLFHFGTALGKLDRNEASAEVFRNSAATILDRAEYLLQEDDKDGQPSRVAEQLRRANLLLRKAESQVPGHEETLKLARERVVLQYLLSIGGRPHPGHNEDHAEDQAWAEKCLGILYSEAARYPERSPYLARELGKIRVRIDSGGLNQVYVNDDNVYAVSVYLQLDGKKKSGILNVRIRENEERCAAIDLFADAPRSLDYPLVIRSPYWREEGEKRVKLSAKTGEPMRKNSRSND